MRKIIAFAVAILALFLASNTLAQEKLENRTITVCALSDISQGNEIPRVSEERARKLVSEVSKEYKENVSISFKLTEFHNSSLDVMSPKDHLDEYRSACASGEIVMVFTNQARVFSEGGELYFKLGDSNETSGVLLLYEVDFMRDRPAALRVLAHEIGHLFGAKEEDMPRGVFWTEKLKKIIDENSMRTWKRGGQN